MTAATATATATAATTQDATAVTTGAASTSASTTHTPAAAAAAAAASAAAQAPPAAPTPTRRRTATAAQIPCCVCGTSILPNAANQCPSCLAQGLQLQHKLQLGPGGTECPIIHQCRTCRRYQRTPTRYEDCTVESPELLAICLQHIPALQSTVHPKLHLVDAGWIWTEPHSMRFQVHVTVRAEIHDVTVQQRVAVELKCSWQMCPDCNRDYTNRTWHALVQLRQKRPDDQAPKTGLRALEQALARNAEIRKRVLRMDSARNGFDFYFLAHPHAQIFASYLQKMAPLRVKTTQKMVSEDISNSTANMKYTLHCDMVPLCRDDLVLVSKQCGARGGGGNVKLSGRLVLVTKVSSVIHVLDAAPLRITVEGGGSGGDMTPHQMELNADAYYRNEKFLRVLLSSHRLVRFVVLDVELIGRNQGNNDDGTKDGATDDQSKGPGGRGGAYNHKKYAWADVVVARESDLGVNDDTFTCLSHLGHLIRSGDVVLGYDLASSTIDGDEESAIHLNSHVQWPDVVLVKKISGSGGAAEVVDEHATAAAASPSSSTPMKGEKPTMTKKKARRRRKYEGKRRRELEASAARMGFLEADNEEDEEEDGMELQDEGETTMTMEANRLESAGEEEDEEDEELDAEWAAEVAALERDLAALDAEDLMPRSSVVEDENPGSTA